MAETCAAFDISRSTFHRWLQRFDPSDLSSLDDLPSDPKAVRQPAVPAAVVALIRAYREREPLVGKERVAQLLLSEHGVTLSASSVGRVIDRECLYFADTPLHWKKRVARDAGVPPARGPEPVQAPVARVCPAPAVAMRLSAQAAPVRLEDRVSRLERDAAAPRLRRTLLLASLLVNVAFLASIAAFTFRGSRTAAPVAAALSGPVSSSLSHP